jgi:transcriptional regulator with GAF, ATPase, and Fis domain
MEGTNITALPNTDAGQELAKLAAVSRIFTGDFSARAACEHVLDVLKQHCGAVRGFVALLDQARKRTRIEASTGSGEARRFVSCPPFEGIVERVIETGKLDVVCSRRENSCGSAEEVTNICFPLTVWNSTIGALSVDFKLKPVEECDSELRILGLIAAMIALAIKAEQVAGNARYVRINESHSAARDASRRILVSLTSSAPPGRCSASTNRLRRSLMPTRRS